MGDPYTCNAVIKKRGWCYFCRLPFGHPAEHEHGSLKWSDGDKGAEAADLAKMPEDFRINYARQCLEERCAKAEREVAELREALAFYAAEGTWMNDTAECHGVHEIPWSAPAWQDRGDTARDALKSPPAQGGSV